jgi:hypothetical protein
VVLVVEVAVAARTKMQTKAMKVLEETALLTPAVVVVGIGITQVIQLVVMLTAALVL